jgi:cell division GTPase FtsZ
MKRRIMIKDLLGFGTMAFLPVIGIAEESVNKRIHFVGLGSAGTTAMVQCKNAGFRGNYSCITGSNVPHLTKDMKHHYFIPSQQTRHSFYFDKNPGNEIMLTPEMKSIFRNDDAYVLFTGLGSCTGTGLISGVLEMLLAEHKNYVAICSLPFASEGKVRNDLAKRKKSEIEKLGNVFFFDHNQILKEYSYLSNAPIRMAFARGDEIFVDIFINRALPIIMRF